jgi:hypothetical protein
MIVSKKTGAGPVWLAWMPFAGDYLRTKISKTPWWPILLNIFRIQGISGLIYFMYIIITAGSPTQMQGMIFLLSFFVYITSEIIYTVVRCIWEWKICVARQRPGWWAIIAAFVPVWQYIMWGILAWGK